jgi:5-carboxymethyl-2-hydroxymuconate isomerase
MPHIVIEYSANIEQHHDVDALVAKVHQAALANGLPEESALRTRGVGRQHYRIATGDADFAFVALHCRVGPGRAAPDLQAFITDVLDAAQSAVGETPLQIAWSVELTEIDPALRINRNHVRSAIEQRSERSGT